VENKQKYLKKSVHQVGYLTGIITGSSFINKLKIKCLPHCQENALTSEGRLNFDLTR
jgi:hypothetical protein